MLNSLRIGGSESKIIRVANALAQSGVAVELAYLDPPETGLSRIDPAVRSVHLRRRAKYSIGALLRNGDQIVFGCAAHQAGWLKKHGLSPQRSQVIYNGVDHEFYAPGNGAEEGRRLRKQLGIPPGAHEGIQERVRFPGPLEDVRPAFSMMDVFVLPSSAVETFSKAALEAMAMARAVAAIRVTRIFLSG